MVPTGSPPVYWFSGNALYGVLVSSDYPEILTV